MYDNSTTERKRTTRMGLFLVGTFVVLMILTNWMQQHEPPPAPQPYRVDPTPYVVETQRIELFSGNKLCIGANVSC